MPLGVRQSPVRQGRLSLTGIAFAANGDLWVAGATPIAVYRSQDDGATWCTAITGPAGQASLPALLSRRPGSVGNRGLSFSGLPFPLMTVPLGVRQSPVRQGRQPLPDIRFEPANGDHVPPSFADDTGDRHQRHGRHGHRQRHRSGGGRRTMTPTYRGESATLSGWHERSTSPRAS